MKTILITGCSSGFGLEAARLFLEREWNVVATMRTPREGLLPRSDRVRVLALDVTDASSIRHAVEAAEPLDVLVNNAGIGWQQTATTITRSSDVAEAVWRAVNDPSCPMRLPAGADAVEWAGSK
jgi:NAD(P)-dependent dehydrogenase (short-subunit alcohol dehydrogenase family)